MKTVSKRNFAGIFSFESIDSPERCVLSTQYLVDISCIRASWAQFLEKQANIHEFHDPLQHYSMAQRGPLNVELQWCNVNVTSCRHHQSNIIYKLITLSPPPAAHPTRQFSAQNGNSPGMDLIWVVGKEKHQNKTEGIFRSCSSPLRFLAFSILE